MGNCTDRFSERDRARHSTKNKSKNDKHFIAFYEDPEFLPFLKQYVPNFRMLLKDLINQREKFEELYELAPDKEETKERLLIDVQKGIDLCKWNCFRRKEVLIRVKFDYKEKYYDTPLTDYELPTWYHFIEITDDLNKANFAIFTAYEHRESASLKFLGECSIALSRLKDQKVFYSWIDLGRKYPELESKILIKLQWIFDESQLYHELVEESSEKIAKITEFLRSYED